MQALRSTCHPQPASRRCCPAATSSRRCFTPIKRIASSTACQAAAAPPAGSMRAPDKARDNSKSTGQLVVELHRLALEAQAEKDMWEAHLSAYELQQQQLKAHLDARARHQAQCLDSLATLRHLLHTARHVAREQHLAVFAESVHHCGRQRLRQERQEERDQHHAFTRATVEAAEQLQQYETTLVRMVSGVMASMAAAESLPLSLPALITGETAEEVQQQLGTADIALSPVPVVAAGSNNIVPAKASVAALLRQQQEQRRQRRAARSASSALV